MHSTLCGSPNISLTRRSPPPPERETKFSKKGNQNPIKLNDDQEVSQYITSPQNILWIYVGRQIWAWRGERLNLFEEIGSFTQRQIQTCSKGSSDHRRNLQSCHYRWSRSSTMFGLLIVLVHSCNILIKCTNYCYTLGMNHILILEVVRQWQKWRPENMGEQYQNFVFRLWARILRRWWLQM